MSHVIVAFLETNERKVFVALALLFVLNVFLFGELGIVNSKKEIVSVSFLDVGQGDAALVELGNGVQVLIDGGPPNGKLLAELDRFLPSYDRTIELVILTHPELDHYGGLIELLRRYEVGAFLDTGATKDVDAHQSLLAIIEEREIRHIRFRSGDRVLYGNHVFTALSPDDVRAYAKETNDTSLVLAFESSGARFLFAGDISAGVERLVAKIITQSFDVLKVAHHGSKFSSAAEFLAAVRPALAVIGVGKNSYGHPTREALARLGEAGARVYRTDRDGAVTVKVESGALKVFAER